MITSSRSPIRLSTIALIAVCGWVIVGLFLASQAFEQEEQLRSDIDAALVMSKLELLLSEVRFEVDQTELVGFRVPPPFLRIRPVTQWLVRSQPDRKRPQATAVQVLSLKTDSAESSLDSAAVIAISRAIPRDASARRPRVYLTHESADPSPQLLVRFPLVTSSAPDQEGTAWVDALIDMNRLSESFALDEESDRYEILLTLGADTVLHLGYDSSATEAYRSVLPRVFPAVEGTWQVVVSHKRADLAVRTALGTIAFGSLIALVLGLMQERRETRRVAERSRELEHLSAELLRANRAKSEFLANVSHELRTPLNAIVGFVDLLRDGVYGELATRQVQPVERIAASANHLRHLVDQILDLAKMAAGRLEVHLEPIDLRPFVLEVASEVESLVSERGLSLSVSIGASLPRIRTDPMHLRQILVNLLGNAVKFTSSGSITVRARLLEEHEKVPMMPLRPLGTPGVPMQVAVGPWIILQVADTGVGIREQDQDRIFDEFEQVNAGPRGDSMQRGTGLGLSISRRLARLVGGDLTIESQVGKGSTFTLWLPMPRGGNADGRVA